MADKNKAISESSVLPPSPSAVLEVGMGEGVVTRTPHILSSLGLGSCVVITLYDTQLRIGGLAHIMLPESSDIRLRNADCAPVKQALRFTGQGMRNEPNKEFPKSEIRNQKYKCADTAIAALLEELQSKGAIRQNMVAKMVGGARMFSCNGDVNTGIGAQNIISVKRLLMSERIPLVGEDVGGHYGRSVEFHLDSGKVILRAIGKEEREI